MLDVIALERIRNVCGFVNGVCLSSVGNSGGIGFWWRDINVPTTSFFVHHITANIFYHNYNSVWRAIWVYGWPEQENKHLTWSLISRLKSESSISHVMFGDFNEIVCLAEKDSGVPRSERLMDAFRGAIDDCGLRDLGFRGNSYTWHRGNSPKTFMRERHDRFLGDSDGCSMFQWFEVRHFHIYKSGHASIMLKASNYYEQGEKGKMFRFEALWLSSEECEEVVAEAWASCIGEQKTTRVSVCAEKLTSWAARCFGNIKKRIKDTKKKLTAAQGRTPDAHMLHECSSLAVELDDLHRLEESSWHARAKANELKDGDKNTSYFH